MRCDPSVGELDASRANFFFSIGGDGTLVLLYVKLFDIVFNGEQKAPPWKAVWSNCSARRTRTNDTAIRIPTDDAYDYDYDDKRLARPRVNSFAI